MSDPMNKSDFRWRAMSSSAAATFVIVSRTHRPHKHRGSVSLLKISGDSPTAASTSLASSELSVLQSRRWLTAASSRSAVRGEILRHRTARRDQRGEIARAERVDGRGRDLRRGHRRRADRNRAVHQDDDDATASGAVLIGRHVGRDVAHPRGVGLGRHARRELDRRKRGDVAAVSVLEDFEIGRRQPFHGHTAPIQRRDIHLHELGSGSEAWHRALRQSLARERGHEG